MDDVLRQALVLEKPEEIFKKKAEKDSDVYKKEDVSGAVPGGNVITH